MVRSGGGFGRTLVWALCLVVVAVVAAISLARYGCQVPTIGRLLGCADDGGAVVLGVRRLNELATAEMTAQVVVEKEKNAHIFTQELPEWLAGQKVLLIARGEVKAGVDLDDLGQDDVHVEGKKVAIHLPEARILDSSLDEDETRVYDWDRGLFIKGDYTLVEEARREALEKIEATARDEDIAQKAQNNAEDSIREFLISLGYDKVMFT
jgi:Protein of unknown function (DUF4230)